MVVPRALVFRPLVKGNEDFGNEIELLLGNLSHLLWGGEGVGVDCIKKEKI